jgi:hypothetical protein
MEIEAAELRAGADAFNAAKDAVFAARAAVGAEEVAQAAKAAAEGENAAAGGALTAHSSDERNSQSTPHQRAALLERDTCWASDVRRFLTAYVAIFEVLAAKKSASKGAAAAAEFTATHSRVLEQLQVVSHFTRTIDMLSTLELNTLEHARTSFVWRATFRSR